jgi:hypothetical protein
MAKLPYPQVTDKVTQLQNCGAIFLSACCLAMRDRSTPDKFFGRIGYDKTAMPYP